MSGFIKKRKRKKKYDRHKRRVEQITSRFDAPVYSSRACLDRKWKSNIVAGKTGHKRDYEPVVVTAAWRLTERDCFRSPVRSNTKRLAGFYLYFPRITGILRGCRGCPLVCVPFASAQSARYVYTRIYSNAFSISRIALTDREASLITSDRSIRLEKRKKKKQRKIAYCRPCSNFYAPSNGGEKPKVVIAAFRSPSMKYLDTPKCKRPCSFVLLLQKPSFRFVEYIVKLSYIYKEIAYFKNYQSPFYQTNDSSNAHTSAVIPSTCISTINYTFFNYTFLCY